MFRYTECLGGSVSQPKLTDKLSTVLNSLRELLDKLKQYFSCCEDLKRDYQQALQLADQIIQMLEEFKKQAPLYRRVEKE